jgi:urease accessory protein
MRADAERARQGRPFVFTDLRRRRGLDRVIDFIVTAGGLSERHDQSVG